MIIMVIIIDRPSFHFLPAGLGLQKKHLKRVLVLCIVAMCLCAFEGKDRSLNVYL